MSDNLNELIRTKEAELENLKREMMDRKEELKRLREKRKLQEDMRTLRRDVLLRRYQTRAGQPAKDNINHIRIQKAKREGVVKK